MGHNGYTVVTFQDGNYASVISDAYAVKFTTVDRGGFETLTFSVPRYIERQYNDIRTNLMVVVLDPFGDRAWEGKITNPARKQTGGGGVSGTNGFDVQALGYASFLQEQNEPLITANQFSRTTDISAFVSYAINPLVTNRYFKSANILNTGVPIAYTNGDNLATATLGPIRGMLDKFYLYGDQNSNFFRWGVWENRSFVWLPRPSTYTLAASVATATEVDVEESSETKYQTAIIKYVRYIDSTTQPYVDVVTVNQSAATYSGGNIFDYPPGSSATAIVPYASTRSLDIRNHGPITITQATKVGTTILKQLSTNKVSAHKISFSVDGAVRDLTMGAASIPLGQVRAGNSILLPDLTNEDWSFNEYFYSPGNGSNPLYSNGFFIAKTTFDVDAGQLDIEPEQSRNMDAIIQRTVVNLTNNGSYLIG